MNNNDNITYTNSVFLQHSFEITNKDYNSKNLNNFYHKITQNLSNYFNKSFNSFKGTLAIYIDINENNSTLFHYKTLSNYEPPYSNFLKFPIELIHNTPLDTELINSHIILLYGINQHIVTPDEIQVFNPK